MYRTDPTGCVVPFDRTHSQAQPRPPRDVPCRPGLGPVRKSMIQVPGLLASMNRCFLFKWQEFCQIEYKYTTPTPREETPTLGKEPQTWSSYQHTNCTNNAYTVEQRQNTTLAQFTNSRARYKQKKPCYCKSLKCSQHSALGCTPWHIKGLCQHQHRNPHDGTLKDYANTGTASDDCATAPQATTDDDQHNQPLQEYGTKVSTSH